MPDSGVMSLGRGPLSIATPLPPEIQLATMAFHHNNVDEAKPKTCILPCAPLAVVKIMERVGIYDERLLAGDRLQGERSESSGQTLRASWGRSQTAATTSSTASGFGKP